MLQNPHANSLQRKKNRINTVMNNQNGCFRNRRANSSKLGYHITYSHYQNCFGTSN
jgi:hypothetical protein